MSYVDRELSVEDMLADPIVRILMHRDGVSPRDIRDTIARARLPHRMATGTHRNLAAHGWTNSRAQHSAA